MGLGNEQLTRDALVDRVRMAHAIVEAGLPALAGDPLELDPYGHQRFAHVARLHEIAFRVVLEEVVEYEVDGE